MEGDRRDTLDLPDWNEALKQSNIFNCSPPKHPRGTQVGAGWSAAAVASSGSKRCPHPPARTLQAMFKDGNLNHHGVGRVRAGRLSLLPCLVLAMPWLTSAARPRCRRALRGARGPAAGLARGGAVWSEGRRPGHAAQRPHGRVLAAPGGQRGAGGRGGGGGRRAARGAAARRAPHHHHHPRPARPAAAPRAGGGGAGRRSRGGRGGGGGGRRE